VGCLPGCPTCTSESLSSCLSCGIDTTNNITYFLQFATTQCVPACPGGQFPDVMSFSCLPCNSICSNCSLVSTNCTACTLVSSVIPVYLYNSTCNTNCPSGLYPNSTDTKNRLCSKCHSYCLTCYGPLNSNCTACANFTSIVAGVTKITLFYKSLTGDICNSSCPMGQFNNPLSANPNNCIMCDLSCIACKTTSTTC
jgi:hypothetical protein